MGCNNQSTAGATAGGTTILFNLAVFSVPPGIWLLNGSCRFSNSPSFSSTTLAALVVGFSTTSAGTPNYGPTPQGLNVDCFTTSIHVVTNSTVSNITWYFVCKNLLSPTSVSFDNINVYITRVG